MIPPLRAQLLTDSSTENPSSSCISFMAWWRGQGRSTGGMRSFGDDQDVSQQTQQHEEEALAVPDDEVGDEGHNSDAQ